MHRDQQSLAGEAPLAGGVHGPEALDDLLRQTLDALAAGARERGSAVPVGGPAASRRRLAQLLGPDAVLPEHGDPKALPELVQALARDAVDPAEPGNAAHLHVPPLAVAVAADLAVSALNPSLDSWDQAPSGIEIENAVVAALARLVGFPAAAAGAFTSGGTESNLTGLLLARDAVLREDFQGARAISREAAGRLRVFCSAAAHFSVGRSAALLGLGADAVVPVDTDASGRMDTRLLDWALADARSAGESPVCVVATAGTTDLGAVDPLPAVAAIAARHRGRLHVDAAYGGGALFSRQLAPLLAGLEQAQTVSLDLHKLGWLPAAAGVLLARDADLFGPLELHAAYLNPEDDEEAGYVSLLGRSLRTTRRPDAFKAAVVLRTLGREGLGALVDRCHALARYAAGRVAAEPTLRLHTEPELTTLAFRYLPAQGDPDRVNAGIRRRLLADGTAAVGRTEIDGAVHLKLTLLNPHTTEAELDRLLERISAAGAAEEAAATR